MHIFYPKYSFISFSISFLLTTLINVDEVVTHPSREVTGWSGIASTWHPPGEQQPLVDHRIYKAASRLRSPHLKQETIAKKRFASTSENDFSFETSLSSFSHGDTVVVKWQGVENPHPRDFVGLYFAPENYQHENLKTQKAGEYEYLDFSYACPSKTSEGKGTIEFRLLNLRRDLYVKFWKYHSTELRYVLFAQRRLKLEQVDQPTQGHLSLTPIANQIRLMWVSFSKNQFPVVYYGLSPTNLTLKSYGVSHTYTAQMMCGAPANQTSPFWFIDPGMIHDAIMTELSYSTRYFYSFGFPSGPLSPVYSFVSPPAHGALPIPWSPLDSVLDNNQQVNKRPKTEQSTEPVIRLLAYGDMGISSAPGAITTIENVKSEISSKQVDMILHVGDISYARGQASIWESFFDLIEPVATKVPYMVGIGNHEYDHTEGGDNDPSHAAGQGFHPSWGNYGNDSSNECGVPFYHRFHMPDKSTALAPFWYSYNYGNIHFIIISTEHDFTHGSAQHAWLEKDLQTIDRQVTPWVILTGHRPMYCSENYAGDYQVAVGIQQGLEDLIFKYQVDLCLWGHYHSYERTCKIYKDHCHEDGVVHVVIGMSGASLDDSTYMDKEWSIYHDQVFGYSRITVHGNMSLHFEYLHNIDKHVADSFWLYK